MNLSAYIDEYASKHKKDKTACKLINGDNAYSLKNRGGYPDSEYLASCIEESVRAYTRNKDIAIKIYKDLKKFLEGKGIKIDINFPTIAISNSFERLMFIAKYLQDPKHKVSELQDILWVSERTINEDLSKLRGIGNDSIQICGKKFKIDDLERHRDTVYFPSTAHPLFLTPNLTQALVTLKGLKAMCDDPLYAEYARLLAADIWEQLSDYAKERIHFVFSKLLPEDLSWYESLQKKDDECFYPETRCGTRVNILDYMKNEKQFCVEYNGDTGVCLYKDCRFIPRTYDGTSIEVTCNQGRVRLYFDKVLRSAYSIEELL